MVRRDAPAWLALAGLVELADALAAAPSLTDGSIDVVRPELRAARKAAALAALPRSTAMPLVRRMARETDWDAAAATLIQETWGELDPAPACDQTLVMDVGLTALVAATVQQHGATAADLRASAHQLVEDLCRVGQPERQRRSA